MPETILLYVNGEPVTVGAGSMVSAAVMIAGVSAFRRSVSGAAFTLQSDFSTSLSRLLKSRCARRPQAGGRHLYCWGSCDSRGATVGAVIRVRK